MLTEQQQRILGYFIDEAKDNLHTIEQGLLNLRYTVKDPEMANEVFRAAHSVKGGAAMLGLDSIQQTAHRLEDYFKVLKECPTIQVDQKLESLFLQVFDILQELLEQLEGSFYLPENVVNNLMPKVESVFKALSQHLRLLLNQAKGREGDKGTRRQGDKGKGFSVSPLISPSSSVPVFQSQVLQQLREMLQLFKQPETPQNRQQLQECCHQLILLGKQFDLQGWCTLCETASGAIANVRNTYRSLAPIIIKELKLSQELVLAGRGAEIKINKQLQARALSRLSQVD